MKQTPLELISIADAIADLVVAKLANRSPDDSYLDVHGVAELLNCSSATVERWTRQGKIPSIKVGRLRRYRRTDLLSLRQQENGSCDE